MNEAQKACADAAEYIGKHGWVQGEYATTDGRVCMLGALSRVATTSSWFGKDANGRPAIRSPRGDAETHLSKYLIAQGLLKTYPNGAPIGSPAIYNDRPEVTQEDAVLALKRAAEWDGDDA